MEESLDSVVATQIICGMVIAIKEGQFRLDEKFAGVVENIFGKGHAPRTTKKIKKCGAKV